MTDAERKAMALEARRQLAEHLSRTVFSGPASRYTGRLLLVIGVLGGKPRIDQVYEEILNKN